MLDKNKWKHTSSNKYFLFLKKKIKYEINWGPKVATWHGILYLIMTVIQIEINLVNYNFYYAKKAKKKKHELSTP